MPCGQASGAAVEFGQYWPGAALQVPADTVTVHANEPVTVLVKPAGHAWQLGCPTCAENVPTPQASQVVEPKPELNRPSGQALQAVAPAVSL